MYDFGSKIKHLRLQCKICQQELCCDILSRTVLSKIENGKVTPSIFQLNHIAKKLNVSINYFLDEDQDVHAVTYKESTINDIFFNLYSSKQYYKLIDLYEKNIINESDSNVFFYLGHSYYLVGYVKDAGNLLKKYINKYLNCDTYFNKNPENFTTALNLLFKYSLDNNDYKKAVHYLLLAKKDLELNNKTNSRIYFVTINNLGSVYCITNQYSKVVQVLENFLSTVNDLSYLKLLPSIHLSLNIAYYNLEEYEKSIYHIKKSIFLYDYSGMLFDAAHCYLNYIKALRYIGRFDEAFNVLNEYKIFYNTEDLYQNFLIQEIILYFNINDYINFKNLSSKLKLSALSVLNRQSYTFMCGHIAFQNEDYPQAMICFQKCEKYFISKNFSQDLLVLYKDLYTITGSDIYKDKFKFYSSIKGKKNILVPKASQ